MNGAQERHTDLDGNAPVRHYRTIWLSDLHLGTKNARTDSLLDFLRQYESSTLYLVGDIIDGWQLKKSWFWDQAHNDVVQKILRKARKGTRVVYISGNHDEFLRPYGILNFGRITFQTKTIHRTADNRQFLVLHGDQFDSVMQKAPWLAHLGDAAYDWALFVNRMFNIFRELFGMEYWSLSAYLKHKVKNAVSFISSYEGALAQAAAVHGVDGIICGHIHKAEMRSIGSVLYCNTGDWVESCTALVEDMDGRLELLRWKSAGTQPEVLAVEEFRVRKCAS